MVNPNETHATISANDLMAMGVNDIAYVRPVEVEGRPAYMVHAADGTQMAVFADREVAFAAVRRHEMEPYSVH
jgi:hypothetical protein